MFFYAVPGVSIAVDARYDCLPQYRATNARGTHNLDFGTYDMLNKIIGNPGGSFTDLRPRLACPDCCGMRDELRLRDLIDAGLVLPACPVAIAKDKRLLTPERRLHFAPHAISLAATATARKLVMYVWDHPAQLMPTILRGVGYVDDPSNRKLIDSLVEDQELYVGERELVVAQ